MDAPGRKAVIVIMVDDSAAKSILQLVKAFNPVHAHVYKAVLLE